MTDVDWTAVAAHLQQSALQLSRAKRISSPAAPPPDIPEDPDVDAEQDSELDAEQDPIEEELSVLALEVDDLYSRVQGAATRVALRAEAD
jgi:hypothetical protein